MISDWLNPIVDVPAIQTAIQQAVSALKIAVKE